ncbi:hypothetical protein J0S82_007677, partial [Galemys pyrenaicus]
MSQGISEERIHLRSTLKMGEVTLAPRKNVNPDSPASPPHHHHPQNSLCIIKASLAASRKDMPPFIRLSQRRSIARHRDFGGFDLECFRAKVSSLSEELKHFADRL